MRQVRAAIEANNEITPLVGPAKSLLHVWLACIRLNDDLNHVARLNISDVQSHVRRTNVGRSFFWAATVSYFMEDFERAIQLTRDGLASSDLREGDRQTLTNNLCYYLTESCLENPSDLAERTREAARLLDMLKPNILLDELKAPARFTQGFFEIVFGETEEKILRGISACENAYRPQGAQPDGFVSLLIEECRRAGWRRILNLDALQKSSSKRGS